MVERENPRLLVMRTNITDVKNSNASIDVKLPIVYSGIMDIARISCQQNKILDPLKHV